MRVITESVRGITINWPRGMGTDEDYWLKEIVGIGEKLLPADCFGNPILSKERD